MRPVLTKADISLLASGFLQPTSRGRQSGTRNSAV